MIVRTTPPQRPHRRFTNVKKALWLLHLPMQTRISWLQTKTLLVWLQRPRTNPECQSHHRWPLLFLLSFSLVLLQALPCDIDVDHHHHQTQDPQRPICRGQWQRHHPTMDLQQIRLQKLDRRQRIHLHGLCITMKKNSGLSSTTQTQMNRIGLNMS